MDKEFDNHLSVWNQFSSRWCETVQIASKSYRKLDKLQEGDHEGDFTTSVFKCYCIQDEATVAVKVIRDRSFQLDNGETKKLFLEKYRNIYSTHLLHYLHVYRMNFENSVEYVLISAYWEYNLDTFRQKLRDDQITILLVAELLFQGVGTLSILVRSGFFHADIKPINIFVDYKEELDVDFVIGDLGNVQEISKTGILVGLNNAQEETDEEDEEETEEDLIQEDEVDDEEEDSIEEDDDNQVESELILNVDEQQEEGSSLNDDESSENKSSSSSSSSVGDGCFFSSLKTGTIGYRAPEVTLNNIVSHCSDMWSLAFSVVIFIFNNDKQMKKLCENDPNAIVEKTRELFESEISRFENDVESWEIIKTILIGMLENDYEYRYLNGKVYEILLTNDDFEHEKHFIGLYPKLVDPLRNNVNIVRSAIRFNIVQYQDLSPELRSNKAILEEAIPKGGCLEFAPENFRNDREIVLKCVQVHGLDLEFASESLRSDFEVVLNAIQSTIGAIDFASEDLLSNREILKELISQSEDYAEIIPELLRKDKTFIIECIRVNEDFFKKILEYEPSWKSNCEVVMEAVKMNPLSLEFAGKRLKKNPKIVECAISIDPEALEFSPLRFEKSYVLRIIETYPQIVFSAKTLKKDREIAEKVVTLDPHGLNYVKRNFGDDREIVMLSINHFPKSLNYASNRLKNDPEIVLKAIELDVLSLEYASVNFTSDRELVYNCAIRNFESFAFASEELKRDRSLVCEIVQIVPNILKHVSDDLRHDLGINLLVYEKDPKCPYLSNRVLSEINHFSEPYLEEIEGIIRALMVDEFPLELELNESIDKSYLFEEAVKYEFDPHMVRATAINSTPVFQKLSSRWIRSQWIYFAEFNKDLLNLIPEIWRSDRGFIEELVLTDGRFIKAASESLKSDKGLVRKAVENHGQALFYVPHEYKDDIELVHLAMSHNVMYRLLGSTRMKRLTPLILQALEMDPLTWKFIPQHLKIDDEIRSLALEIGIELYEEFPFILDFDESESHSKGVSLYSRMNQIGPELECALKYMNGSNENYGKSSDWFSKLAEHGDSLAQYYFGSMFYEGKGMKQEYSKAFYWFEQSAKQGQPQSLSSLAIMYLKGEHTTRDFKKAFELFHQAAEYGHGVANFPFQLTLKSAERRNPDAQYFLGKMATNQKEAFEWFYKSARQENVKSQCELALMYKYGRGVNEDQDVAFDWFLKSALQGNADAQYNVAQMYALGQSVKVDYRKAFEYYQLAAEQSHHQSQYFLGIMYLEGSGPPEKDYSKAFEWMNKSANQGNIEAQFSLGLMHLRGEGTEKDFPSAFYWFEKSAIAGHSGAQYNLAGLYGDESSFIFNLSKSFEWCLKSAEQGNEQAQFRVGEMYQEGKGVDYDWNQSLKWLKEAAKQGYGYGQRMPIITTTEEKERKLE